LYLASFSAVRYNPLIKAFYDRLRAALKPPKVARGCTQVAAYRLGMW
jgi:hypothetical protein